MFTGKKFIPKSLNNNYGHMINSKPHGDSYYGPEEFSGPLDYRQKKNIPWPEQRDRIAAKIFDAAFNSNNKWDTRFLQLAELIASWSKDPSTKTGAVIVDSDRRVVSVGYNGLPKGVDDLDHILNTRELKYKMMVHCERNAMLFAKQSLKGCTLYTVPFMSCAPCAAMVIQSGITRVVAPFSANPRWKEDFMISEEMFKCAGVTVDLIKDGLLK